MTPVFLDTVGLIALWDGSDQWHLPAVNAFEKLLEESRILITTPFVLLECGNAASRRTYRNDVVELRESLLNEQLLVDPTMEELEQAWIKYSQGVPGDAGIVDQMSFAVMRRLGVTEAFTNDRHFKSEGFTTLF